ncbi:MULTISPECIES: hypothetical protein [unclassified Streptomyces]|uniref:hypothetical protein n=1 Tax=unclassified Streptomyces TaxID=2593676 RepID=UPI002DD9D1BC|nr:MULTISPECIES: hypothetical protein [unclassified Streptomyces]WSS46779.1 hypothetical protein OG220_40115 [Streptomyces sp. NBC_01187]WSA97702.1 hypothetical protein OIE63_40095 [Streptomyces sp. NBC_01795]WSB82047.1 hypothetical protein OHB04_40715 [Streptomyces sp. NBC_01775]WSS18020.1 hypothetical protein OG533_39795 [Streptomyces sp. NBC_01186]WSS47004.1 hypothetical protein OG220_41510 [Streptomyces sp. NBC_01187]
MSEDAHHWDDVGSPVAEAALPLPLEFEALYVANQEAYHQYARLITGSQQAAEAAVHRAFLEILRHWDALLTESNMQGQIWAILRKTVVSQELNSFREKLAPPGR